MDVIFRLKREIFSKIGFPPLLTTKIKCHIARVLKYSGTFSNSLHRFFPCVDILIRSRLSKSNTSRVSNNAENSRECQQSHVVCLGTPESV